MDQVGETKQRVYDALVEGATFGLTDEALYNFVIKRVPKANNKRIVRASLLAISDPALTDRNILNVIYALAIKHRLDDLAGTEEEEEDVTSPMTRVLENAPRLSIKVKASVSGASLALSKKKPRKQAKPST